MWEVLLSGACFDTVVRRQFVALGLGAGSRLRDFIDGSYVSGLGGRFLERGDLALEAFEDGPPPLDCRPHCP